MAKTVLEHQEPAIDRQSRPLVTVVTVVRNAIATLRCTLDSVLEQDLDAAEYVVIDGCSSDGSQELLREYAPRLDKLVIEPDEGIANAMNKGLALARGDFVVFLHADDRFVSTSSLRLALDAVRHDERADIYAFCIDRLKSRGSHRQCPRRWHFLLNLKQSLPHQGAICRRQLLSDLGGFDESFQIAMDYELFLRARRVGCRFKNLPFVLSLMGGHGISSRLDPGALRRRLIEERKAHRRHAHSAVLRGLYAVYWAIYPPYKSILVYGNPFLLRLVD
jgi:glycosyltransferase involved in cell wall biosynthesis